MTESATYPMKLAALIEQAAERYAPIICAECGRPIKPGQKFAFDHRHAKARAGANAIQNLRAVHDESEAPFDCHDRKTYGGKARATTRGSDIAEAAKTKRMGRENATHAAVMAGDVAREPSRLQGRGFSRVHQPMRRDWKPNVRQLEDM